MSPVLPKQFTAILPIPSTTLADAMVNMELKFTLLFYQWYASVYNEDGTFTAAFQRDICNVKANC